MQAFVEKRPPALLLALESILLAPRSPNWLLSGLGVPAAGVGAIASHRTRSPLPFLAGLLLTALPLVLFLVLPGPPPFFPGEPGAD